jgi:hypothetical protein
MQITLAKGLGEILSSVIEGTQSRDQLNRLVAVSHALASAFLYSKLADGHMNNSLFTLSPSDLAYDCLGDLFRQDDDGQLVQIKTYFEGIDFSRESDYGLLIHLRRLVIANVNNGLFRMYNEADPSLGKILRNIKLAIGALRNFEEIERFGENLIVPHMSDPLFHLPPMERAHLERTFSALANGREHVPALMAKLSLVLRQQEEFCRAVPLMMVARIFRTLYAGYQEIEKVLPDSDRSLEKEELRAAIARACRETLESAGRRYTEHDRIDPALLRVYASAIEQNLICRIVEQDGKDYSYFSGLQLHFPSLTREEYLQKHRAKVEYLGRLTLERLVQTLGLGARNR